MTNDPAESAWQRYRADMLDQGGKRRQLRRRDFIAGWMAAFSTRNTLDRRGRAPLVVEPQRCILRLPNKAPREAWFFNIAPSGFARYAFSPDAANSERRTCSRNFIEIVS